MAVGEVIKGVVTGIGIATSITAKAISKAVKGN